MIRFDRRRGRPLRRGTVAVLAVTTIVSGCGVRVVSDDADSSPTTAPTTTVADEQGSTGTTQPAETTPEESKTEDSKTRPDTTEPSGSGGGSTGGDDPTDTTKPGGAPGGSLVEPISCDEFEALTPGGRMLSVYNGSAPEAGCDELVGPARVASDVFTVTADLAKNYGAVIDSAQPSPLVADATCENGQMTLVTENAFTSPLVLWGSLRFADADDVTVAFKPFITGVLQPGEQATISADGREFDPDSCAYDLRPLVAPVGELAPDVGGPKVDGPQSADAPEDWFPALIQAEIDANESGDPADYPDFVEDIHSPDLWVALFLDGAIEQLPDSPSEPDTTEPSGGGGQQVVLRSPETGRRSLYCSTIDNPVIEGVDGEFAMVMFEWADPSSSTADIFGFGLYRRGSDTRWRYIGRTVHVWEGFSTTRRDRCDPPPMID